MPRVRMAVVGVGHLGKEHARILASFPDVELVGVADVNAEQARAVAERCNTVACTDYRTLLDHVDAAVIAVPTTYHCDVARDFLARGIHLLVEKPLAASLAEADELVDIARHIGALLQVGHIERFNPVYLDLEQRRLQPKFIEAQRLGGFTGRSLDIGVVLDLMIHDIDVVLALLRSPLRSVEAMGVSILGMHEDLAHARLTFANGCMVNLTASRVSPQPYRKMRILSPEGYVAIDFAKRHAKVVQPTALGRAARAHFRGRRIDPPTLAQIKDKLYGQYLEAHQIDLHAVDQLTLELQHFIECVGTGRQPKVGGEDGRNAIEVAARIVEHINGHCWEGHAAGPIGPRELPAALGSIFGIEEAA
jgi:predicted dehydrogenase